MLLQELQVHQIELEMQNEELQRSREEAEEGRARYADLYEFAPVGYLTLGLDGVIHQVNLTGARLFGQERSRIVGRRLAGLLAPECLATFNAFFAKSLVTPGTKYIKKRKGWSTSSPKNSKSASLKNWGTRNSTRMET